MSIFVLPYKDGLLGLVTQLWCDTTDQPSNPPTNLWQAHTTCVFGWIVPSQTEKILVLVSVIEAC